MGSLYRLLHWLTETNLFIALGAAMYAGSSYWFFGLRANWNLLGLVFFATLFTYNFQRRIGDLHKSKAYLKWKWAFMIVSLPSMAIMALGLSWNTFLVLLPAGALAMAYAIPIIPVAGGAYSLRKVPYMKAWVILLTWIMAGQLAVWLESAALFAALATYDLLLFAIQQGALILALTLCFDIRDLKVDAAAQKTLPQMLGVEGARALAIRALYLSALAAGLHYLFGNAGSAQLLAHLAVLAVAITLARRCHPERPELYFTVALDGLLILQGGLLYLMPRSGILF